MQNMARAGLALAFVASLLGCGSRDLGKVRQAYVQIESSGRKERPVSEVHFLEAEPQRDAPRDAVVARRSNRPSRHASGL
jgi:hypothetical protein